MKYLRILCLLGGLLLLVGLVAYRRQELALGGDRVLLQVLMVTDGFEVAGGAQVREAYRAVLEEEGIPHSWVRVQDLLHRGTADLRRMGQVLVFPDTLARRLSWETAGIVTQFAQGGGIALVVRDAGSLTPRARLVEPGMFADVLGLDYTVQALKGQAEHQGTVRFRSEDDARFWQIPPGKLTTRNELSGYKYGALRYTVTTARPRPHGPRVYAECRDSVVLARMSHGTGAVYWCGLPLGPLKANGDDMLMRLVLRAVILDAGHVPHLVGSPDGEGGVAIAWHIDSNAEHPTLSRMVSERFLRAGLRCEMDVTAGPDCGRIGDTLGFDAGGRGRRLLDSVKALGDIGSHGGWAHDWFAEGLERAQFSERQVEELIRKNNRCLDGLTGGRVESYAAPKGVHPQPMVTRILEKMGAVVYYYTGDSGSPPTRSFFKGEMVSTRTWAFPVLPCGLHASLYELRKNGVSPQEVEKWYQGVLDYVARNHTVRMVYSHPHDIFDTVIYRGVLTRFLDRLEKLQKEHAVQSGSMLSFARFMQRFVQTKARFAIEEGLLVVVVENPSNLRSICLALPRRSLAENLTLPAGLTMKEEGPWLFITVTDDRPSLRLALPLAKGVATVLPSVAATPVNRPPAVSPSSVGQ